MANFQTRILHLDLCVVIILLTYTDYSKSYQEQRIRQQINETVFVGETVTLHCNRTPFDEDWTWKMNSSVIFSYNSNNNNTLRSFSSNRIHINPVSRELKIHQIQASDAGNYTCYPAAIRWTLTITENTTASLKQMPLYTTTIIIISCSVVIMVFLIISISICIHRNLRQKISSGSHKEDVKMISHFDRHTITACVYSLHTVS
ncbi:uncharacterized protein LOC143723393 [Siphateles boraxobius]|uniref:uncharacterized protein LOC143723393 n=1 Tax=Siphateles boraxobius TaxID=180520 RepID=UPI004062D359